MTFHIPLLEYCNLSKKVSQPSPFLLDPIKSVHNDVVGRAKVMFKRCKNYLLCVLSYKNDEIRILTTKSIVYCANFGTFLQFLSHKKGQSFTATKKT